MKPKSKQPQESYPPGLGFASAQLKAAVEKYGLRNASGGFHLIHHDLHCPRCGVEVVALLGKLETKILFCKCFAWATAPRLDLPTAKEWKEKIKEAIAQAQANN
jgi:hypothetical protein